MTNFKIIISGLGGILLLLIVIPLVNMIATADPGVMRSTIIDPEVIQSILLTLRAALYATLTCLVFGIPLAYTLARWDFPGKTLVQGAIDLPVMIPHTAAGIALLMVYGPEFLLGKAFARVGVTFPGTIAGISLAMAFVSLPFLVNAARDGFLPSIRPGTGRQDAGGFPLGRRSSRSAWRFWRSILWAILMRARGIAEFGAVVMLTYHPMIAPFYLGAFRELRTQIRLSRGGDSDSLLCLVFFSGLRWLAGRKKEG